MLKDIKTYTVYYGAGQPPCSCCDFLILEPKGQTESTLGALRERGALLGAYLSLAEAEKTDPLYALVGEDGLLFHAGALVRNPEYDTVYMDLSSERVRRLLLQRAGEYLEAGYDGIFADTLGSVELLPLPADKKEAQFRGGAQLLRELKERHPGRFIIQNNGMLWLLDYTAPWIDGVCFENPPLARMGNMLWSFSVLRRLCAARKETGVQVFVLQEEAEGFRPLPSAFLRMYARRLGFLYSRARRYYL